MSSIVSYLNPWRRKREREAEQVRALRDRDGDACARCRRPLRFDLPRGHDAGAKVEPIRSATDGRATLDNLCLTHGRCNVSGADHTGEVGERIRRRSEAALLGKARTRKPKAA